jgi:hypothetical protein
MHSISSQANTDMQYINTWGLVTREFESRTGYSGLYIQVLAEARLLTVRHPGFVGPQA